jgi:hypothetical protein
MDVAGLVIAIGALAVSAVSVIFTALERRRRITEVDLLKRQVEGEEGEREARKRAELVAAHGGISGGAIEDEHEFGLMNGGPAIARAIDVWTRRDGSNEDVTSPQRAAVTLGAGEGVEVRVRVPAQESRKGGLSLWARWRDDTGDREDPLLPLRTL